jgi:hypothetical protein
MNQQPNGQKPHATFDLLWILYASLWVLVAFTWAANARDGLSFQSFVAGFLGLAALKYLIRFEP